MIAPTRITKRGRPVLSLVLALVALTLGSVAVHRVIPPPMTFLMVSRALEGEGMTYRWRSLDDISPRLVEAVIASEDSTFCAHHGFDMKAIEKALKANERGGRIRGGSTISQQTAKNVYLWPGRDWIRKGLEAGYTVLIETLWGKRRVMEVSRAFVSGGWSALSERKGGQRSRQVKLDG